ncbi:TetR/AcrR family transcriptional regulator (plasmid) [Streptomyces sp. BHT-5-2]|uniref:TetR/AcrR family transcriptional regulator n=1 Tax=Streptomyces sp. BHT-5-2 TaxID=2866715 RepID=UPI001C8D4A90|nr:TetR/AcrR family transcriptional regulator [Streptomyces sp. BHT-5-2]QZL08303.1 TetR/AcrR family transcriptional regulator [Streptomyces sp. BHT-5-2]
MPRQVDHESRRRRIADAVCQLADESGLEGVTLRDVAARAEVSMGAVQRCFRTKEEMLVFALTHIGEQITARVTTRLASSPAQSARTTLGHAATEVALLQEQQRAEARVWLAFVAQAAVTPRLAASLRDSYAELQQLFARLIAEATGTATPQRSARALLALTDGLTTHVLIGHLSPTEALDVLDDHLTRLWGEAPT